jgi:nucleoside-diphosphate-sugar epimerase
MTNGIANSVIGVLGCGYVGQQLLAQPFLAQPFLAQQSWHSSSWHTVYNHRPDSGFTAVAFSLDEPDSWHSLPSHADCLVLTIPPGYQDVELETQRLFRWCQWMAVNRSALKRLIYLSTIGVYSTESGVYNENDHCQPDGLRGQLRLDTEQLLQKYFQCTAIRCGGIYGAGSNIVDKLLAGDPVYRGNKAVYRIHVDDLVGIISQLISQPWQYKAVNAVDDRSASQDEVIDWLMLQSEFAARVGQTLSFHDKRLDNPVTHQVTAPKRVISNNLLLEGLGYRLKYPSYQQGLGVLF